MQINSETNALACGIAADCLHMRVRMLSRVLSRLYDDALRPFGVKSSQFNILVAAGTIGRVTPRQLARQLQLDVSTVSRNVERLRARGLLAAVDDDDGRARPFRLTEAGARLIEESQPSWSRAQNEAARLLGEGRFEAVFGAAERIRKQATEP